MITCEDLTVQYGTKDVVRSLTFTVNKGEVFGIIGPNGSGKTSLLKAINGGLPAADGRIEIDG